MVILVQTTHKIQLHILPERVKYRASFVSSKLQQPLSSSCCMQYCAIILDGEISRLYCFESSNAVMKVNHISRVLHNMRYQSEMHLKFHLIWFAHSLFLIYSIISKFYTEHGSGSAVPCVKFQYNWMLYRWTRFREMWVWDAFRTDIPYCSRPQTWTPTCHQWGQTTDGMQIFRRKLTTIWWCSTVLEYCWHTSRNSSTNLTWWLSAWT